MIKWQRREDTPPRIHSENDIHFAATLNQGCQVVDLVVAVLGARCSSLTMLATLTKRREKKAEGFGLSGPHLVTTITTRVAWLSTLSRFESKSVSRLAGVDCKNAVFFKTKDFVDNCFAHNRVDLRGESEQSSESTPRLAN